ncbi:unnamed protein product [Prunus brigantina]
MAISVRSLKRKKKLIFGTGTGAVEGHRLRARIIYRFGVPETITTDIGTLFISREVTRLEEQHEIRFVQSSPYFPQANGQAEATNKVLISIIKKMTDSNPRN